MIAEDTLSEGDFTEFNVRNKDTIHEMVSMSEKNYTSNPKSEVSQEDVEEWSDADKGILVSCTIAVEDLSNAVINPTSESKPLENVTSDKENVPVKISKAAEMYSTLLKFIKSQPFSSAQEVMQLHILHSTFVRK
jgi:hypothetical protein